MGSPFSRLGLLSHFQDARIEPTFNPFLTNGPPLPRDLGLPLSRLSMADIKREVIRRGLVASIGETTLWRWLSEDAIRPLHHRSWIFPRDPDFTNKAGRVLDLYEGTWEGQPLRANEYVICADEKTSIQARRRKHRTTPPSPEVPMRVET